MDPTIENQSDVYTFASWNGTGSNKTKCGWFNNFCNNNSVAFAAIQEHFRIGKNTEKYFYNQFSDFRLHNTPAVRSELQTKGRASGGLLSLWRKNLKIETSLVSSCSKRIQGQVLNISSRRILWLNVYFPCDEDNKVDELIETLANIEAILTSTTFNDVILSGDINWDPSRSSIFAKTVKAWLVNNDLTSMWDLTNPDHTHTNVMGDGLATLDHFIVSASLLGKIVFVGACHPGDTPSNHDPIIMKLRLGSIPYKDDATNSKYRTPAWRNASTTDASNYTNDMKERMKNIDIPKSLYCVDHNCQCEDHLKNQESFLLDVITQMVECSYQHIPMTKKFTGRRRSTKTLWGWKEMVEPARKESILWHHHWLREGKPSEGWLLDTMKKKRKEYHLKVKECRRQDANRRAQKLLEASMQGDKELLDGMRRVHSPKADVPLPDFVSGANGEDDIAKMFLQTYNNLYNLHDDAEDTNNISEEINTKATAADSTDLEELDKITGANIKASALRLKAGKMDISKGFSSDCILHSPDEFFNNIALAFRSFFVHGSVPRSILCCSLLPLRKGSKDPSLVKNYRAIAGSSLIYRLLENFILTTWGNMIPQESLQFGFRKGCGTSQCTWLAMEVIQHFKRNNTRTWVVALDCSQAFDCCKWSKLFKELLMHLPILVVRLLLVSYKGQEAWISWGNITSERFPINNGSGQGRVLSPLMWSIYMLPLFRRLRNLGLGCHFDDVYVACLGYADDILLLLPSRMAALLSLDVCEQWGREYSITFSTDEDPKKSKTKVMLVEGSRKMTTSPQPLTLYGRVLPFVDTIDHLGHTLSSDGTMEKETKGKKARLLHSVMATKEEFYFAHPREILRAIKVYAGSLYGSPTWDFSGDETRKLFNSWRTIVKDIYDVPRGTHRYIVDYLLSEETSLMCDVMVTFTTFVKSLMTSPVMEVTYVASRLMGDMRTTLGKNLAMIEESTMADPLLTSRTVLRNKIDNLLEIPEDGLWVLEELGELIGDQLQLHYHGLDSDDGLDEIISALCLA